MSSEAGARMSPALRPAIYTIAAALAGMLLVTLLCQIPVTHRVDVGRFDAGYVRGFYDPERLDLPQARAYLNGSDGSARWTRAESFLLFPQAGLPAEVTLRLRGWRADGSPPNVAILIDGREAYTGVTTGEWQEIRLAVQQSSLKPEDVLITLRADTAPISSGDPRPAGVLVDAAEYRTARPPLQPYPAQLAWGALAGALLALALADAQWGGRAPWLRFLTPLHAWVAGMLLIGLAYLLLYRLQPAYPYPLRGLLPGVCALLGATMAVRYGPALAARQPTLPDVLAAGGIVVWTTAILLAAQDHVTLSVPGVEKDFRVFATRAIDLALIFRADGFYHLGYPLLLWCVAPLTEGNVFLAARLIAACAGAVFLGASWVLARCTLGRGLALAALTMLALNPFVVQYALYIGSDMPFAAFCALTLALLARWTERKTAWLLILAGVAAGCAFLVRHPGILLFPFGVLVVWMRREARGARRKGREAREARGEGREGREARGAGREGREARGEGREGREAQGEGREGCEARGEGREARGEGREGREARETQQEANVQRSTFNAQRSTFNVSAFALAFFAVIAPQVIVNVRDTGNPFYNQQAKNIWLAVYGDSDWGRWNEVSNDVPLADVILEDPARFANAWWSNLRAFIGAGAESSGDAGQASQLRLLAFPANWLAVVGLVGWLALIGLQGRSPGFRADGGSAQEVPDDHIRAATHPDGRLISRREGIRPVRRPSLRGWTSVRRFTKGDDNRGQRRSRRRRRRLHGAHLLSTHNHTPATPPFAAPLLVWVALYTAVLAVGLPLQRFFLPLAPIYALAAAWTLALAIGALATRWAWHPARLWIIGVLVFLLLLWQGFALGAREVLDRQPVDEVAAIRLVQQTVPSGKPLRAILAPGDPVGKYSAIAHRIATPDQETRYLLHSSELGPRPDGTLIAVFGRYALVQVQQ
ncbi:MAG: glycosyltransferase family 39 protein [Roseiflexus sp.]